MLAKVFDHCSMKYKKEFRLLTLGWSDGNSFVPINHCLLSAAKDENLLCAGKQYDGYSLAARIRNRKRRGRSKYLLSIDVMVGKENDKIPAKLVCVRNKCNKKYILRCIECTCSSCIYKIHAALYKPAKQ